MKHHRAGIGLKNLEEVQKLKKRLEDMKWEEVLEEVAIFRVSEFYDREKKRITMMLAPHMRDASVLVGNCLEQVGWKEKGGRRPRPTWKESFKHFWKNWSNSCFLEEGPRQGQKRPP